MKLENASEDFVKFAKAKSRHLLAQLLLSDPQCGLKETESVLEISKMI